MKYFAKKSVSAVLCIAIFACCLGTSVFGADVKSELDNTASYIVSAVPSPQVNSIGGEWAVLALARGGANVPKDYYTKYLESLKSVLKNQNGVLHSVKYTEYSRATLAVTSLGGDARNVAGYDLIAPLADYDNTIKQGLNGAIWALLALDCGNYPIPAIKSSNTKQATREMYVNFILSRQNKDGGFSLSPLQTTSDVDITSMALCALSNYRTRKDADTAISKALDFLSRAQNSDAGYGTLENTAQVIIALTSLNLPNDDERFTKSGQTLLDNLMSFKIKGGGFAHFAAQTSPNQMATEQAMMALVSLERQNQKKSYLYAITDVIKLAEYAKQMKILIGTLIGK